MPYAPKWEQQEKRERERERKILNNQLNKFNPSSIIRSLKKHLQR
jgi:hypothetical protein